MDQTGDIQGKPPVAGATLSDVLRRVTASRMPVVFSATLQLALPVALAARLAGHNRTAGALLATSMFGLWGFAQQRLEGSGDVVPTPRSAQPLWRVVRRAAAAVGLATTVWLMFDAFTRIMAAVYQCPGCSG